MILGIRKLYRDLQAELQKEKMPEPRHQFPELKPTRPSLNNRFPVGSFSKLWDHLGYRLYLYRGT